MGRPSKTVNQVKELHALFLTRFPLGQPIENDVFYTLVCRCCEPPISDAMARVVVRTGANLGYWQRILSRGPGRPGAVALLPGPPQAPIESPVGQPSPVAQPG